MMKVASWIKNTALKAKFQLTMVQSVAGDAFQG